MPERIFEKVLGYARRLVVYGIGRVGMFTFCLH
jgi:hypothetical protein